ncbi:MAG: glycine--tRNA ligase [Catenulispora sp.]|nr:glycine--tRNA ligase [Catenulispora sp.]
MLTMQDALLTLTRYWTERGCIVVQPMNTEVGAGTLNPATSLRVLGPEPWRVCYVEPSVRPDDSRYGDNPNRLQTHTQFQVIIKPEPGDPQELFLGSLEALGIDVAKHDVRFVEDNWAFPAMGAWGLGWEVWLDGLEITQFTYFQQFGIPLDPVPVEITYGMERIIMALQGVTHFKDIVYAPGITYGEIFGQSEFEMSRYYLDEAGVQANQALFEAYATEVEHLVEQRLPVPATTYILKCSQTFNVLDARGAVSTTERARAFARMRNLSLAVGKLWVERRKELGFPLGEASIVPPAAETETPTVPTPQAPELLAFEIGVEELPPAEVDRAATAVRRTLAEKLAATRLGHGAITVLGTPRRIIATVEDVAPREPDVTGIVRGPRASAAFDENGAPTAAALGFARGHGIAVEDLVRLDADPVEHVGFERTVAGRGAVEVLAELLPTIVTGLRGEKNMRWNAPGLAYSRPVRWISALLGAEVVPFAVAGLHSDRTTRVHRTAPQPVVAVARAQDYLATLRTHGIEPDNAVRRALVEEGVGQAAATVGGAIDLTADAALIDEIANLVEEPTPILGSFASDYLELPSQILTTVMRKHQRYLPVSDGTGALLPYFVTVANGRCDHDAVRLGNENVLRARYEDARFFWRNDLQEAPETMKARIGRLLFEARLGSMADRADRIARAASAFADHVGLDTTARTTLKRAGELVKFDLGSGMVVEMSGLAGTMAREYARRAGEDEATAQALYEAELPRHSLDALPQTLPGALLALADRFDLLAGLFAIGSVPTGSSDPFGLRRAAIGVINILRSRPELSALTISDGFAAATALQPVEPAPGVQDDFLDFVARRFEQLMLDEGHSIDHVRAVGSLITEPARAEATVRALQELHQTPRFRELAAALQRVRRIVPAGTQPEYDSTLLESDAEHDLDLAIRKAALQLRGVTDLELFTEQAHSLAGPINAFFDAVLVMADDPAIRANRLGLLAAVYQLAAGQLDWEQLRD